MEKDREKKVKEEVKKKPRKKLKENEFEGIFSTTTPAKVPPPIWGLG